MAKVRGSAEPVAPSGGVHQALAGVQEKTAFLSGYGFKTKTAVSAGTSVAGLVGGLMTLVLAGLIGYGLKRRVAG